MPIVNGRLVSNFKRTSQTPPSGSASGARKPKRCAELDALVAETKQTMRDLEKDLKAGRPPARQPPAEHRFQPGQSGNPAGRPPGSRNKLTKGRLARLVIKACDAAAPNAPADQPAPSLMEAMVTALLAKASRGDLKAIALALPLISHSEAVADEADARDAHLAAAAEAARLEAEAHAEDPEIVSLAHQMMSRSIYSPTRPRDFPEALQKARSELAERRRKART